MKHPELVKYGIYVSSLMGHSIRGTEPDKPWDNFDWNLFFHIANHHNVLAIVRPSLSYIQVPEEYLKKIDHQCNRLIAREARQELEFHRVFDVLDNEGVEIIKLKGISLKNYYPLPHMRTSSDVDICMSKEDRARCGAFMEELGYELDTFIDYHDEYCKDKFFFYELHSQITADDSEFFEMFANPFDKAIPDPLGRGLIFNDEYFYLHLVTHLYKHFVAEGCGLRLFCDLYVFERTHPNIDMAFVRSILEKYGILDFYNNMSILVQCFLEGKPLYGKYENLAEHILLSGEHGINELKRLSRHSKDHSSSFTSFDKINYFLGNWFPGVKVMSKKHPILNKVPILLPVFWVERVFYTLFCKPEALKKQYQEIKRINSDDLAYIKEVHKMAHTK